MHKVFICHSSHDKPFIRRLASQLEFYGLDVWIDEKEIAVGESLSEKIESALENSEYVIVVFSKKSIESKWVQKELRAAYTLELERGKNVIIPVLLQKSKIPLFLRDKKYANFSVGFDDGMAEILTSFFGHDKPPQHQLKNTDCAILIDVVRLDGSIAKYTKRQTLKCVKGIVNDYIEAFEATGTVRDFATSGGKIVNERWEGGLNHLTIQLSKPLEQGAILKKTFSCNFYGTFIDEENSWEEREYYPTDALSITIRFPKGRPPKAYKAYAKYGANVIEDLEHKVTMRRVKGKPALVFKPKPSKPATSYVIRWEW